jgi:hypothetical protein
MLASLALPATIRISHWSTIPRSTIHGVCSVMSISHALKPPLIFGTQITETQITQTQVTQTQVTQTQITQARPAP